VSDRNGAVPAAAYLVLTLVWAMTVPVYGSLALSRLSAYGVAWPHAAGWFCAAAAAGGPLFAWLWRQAPGWAAAGAGAAGVTSALLTTLFWLVPAGVWPVLFAGMGLATGAGMTAWGSRLSAGGAAGTLGRTIGYAAAIVLTADTVLRQVGGRLPAADIVTVVLPLLAGASALWAAWTVSAPAADEEPPLHADWPGLLRTAALLVLLGLVGATGLRFLLVHPGPAIALTVWLERGLFAAGLVCAGHFLDRGEVQGLSLTGAALLVVSFLYGLTNPNRQIAYFSPMLDALAYGILAPVPWALLLGRRSQGHGAGRMAWGIGLLALEGFGAVLIGGPWSTVPLERLGLPAAFAVLLAGALLAGVATRTEILAGPGDESTGDLAAEGVAVGADPAERLARLYGDRLSKRELEVASLAIAGVASKEIAEQLFLTESTVKTHLKNVYRKTETANRNDLYRKLVSGERPEGPAVQAARAQGDAAPAADPAQQAALSRDPATGMPDRMAFGQVIQTELSLSLAVGRPLALAMIRVSGLDGAAFGPGRAERSQALQVVASILTTSLRSADTVFRWRTDQFLLLLPASGYDGARDVALRLARRIAAWAEARGITTTVSVGCASTDRGLTTPAALLAEAQHRINQGDDRVAPGDGTLPEPGGRSV
jgi:diguanylate cyclase (GGDEF)-like protein